MHHESMKWHRSFGTNSNPQCQKINTVQNTAQYAHRKCAAAVYVNVRPFANASSINSPVSSSKKVLHIIQNDDSAQQLSRRSLAILRLRFSGKYDANQPADKRWKQKKHLTTSPPTKKKHIAKFSRKMFLLHLGTRGPGTRGSQGDLWASTLFCLSVALQCLGFFFFPSIPLQPFWVWLGDKGTGTWGGLGGHGGAGFSSSQLYHYNLLGFHLGTRGLRPHYNLRVWHGSRDVIAFLRVSGDYWLRTREWGLHRESWELGARTIADWYLEYDIMDIYVYIYIYCLYI